MCHTAIKMSWCHDNLKTWSFPTVSDSKFGPHMSSPWNFHCKFSKQDVCKKLSLFNNCPFSNHVPFFSPISALPTFTLNNSVQNVSVLTETPVWNNVQDVRCDCAGSVILLVRTRTTNCTAVLVTETMVRLLMVAYPKRPNKKTTWQQPATLASTSK